MYILFIKWPGEDKEDVEEYITKAAVNARASYLASMAYEDRPKWRSEPYESEKHGKILENAYANRRK